MQSHQRLVKNLLKLSKGFKETSVSRYLGTASNDSSQTKFSYATSDTRGYKLIGTTLDEALERTASEKPNHVAYKYCYLKRTLTFSEVKQRVDEIAQNLLSRGFEKGDRLAVMLPNMPEGNLAILAAASIGVIVVVMNPAYQLVEIEYMLKKTKCKGVVILDNLKTIQHYQILTQICPELLRSKKGELNSEKLPDLKHVILASLNRNASVDAYKGCWSFKDFESFDSSKIEKPSVQSDDLMTLLFTSGSTGFPKAAMLTQHGILNSSSIVYNFQGFRGGEENNCIPIPSFHIFGFVTGTIAAVLNGCQSTYPHILPDTLSTIKAIHTERCTSIKGAPVIFLDLINHPELKNYDLSSLKSMIIGASTVPKELVMRVKQVLNLKCTTIGYAMTESSCSGTMTQMEDAEKSEKFAYESIGRPFPFVEAKIVDPKTNEIVARNMDGELLLRGFNIMKGYWDEPEKTAETIDKDGWLRTGDIACMDEHDYIYYKSRSKELVIRGGVNIYPAEVERFFRTHESVMECFVVGVPDSRVGEELCAWVKLKPDAKQVSADELKEFCKGKVAYFKIPKYIKFVDAFPINATGKVQKFKMQEQMKKELANQK